MVGAAVTARDNAILVSSLISGGERTPLFTDNQEFASVHASYGKPAGKITQAGEKSMHMLGEIARKQLVDTGFMYTSYDPKSVFVRSANDNVSILSAYAYIMGMYPKSIEGVDLTRGFDDLTNIEITEKDVDEVRSNVGGTKPTCGDQRLDIYPGNEDREFLIKPMHLYSGLKNTVTENMKKAKDEFEMKYNKNLYEKIAKAMNKDSSKVNFYNTIHYLDDYITAKANSKSTPYSFDAQTDSLIDEYYMHYYEKGLFRDDKLNRVFTSAYLTNLGKEILAKHELLTKGKDKGKHIETLKHAVHVGNDQTYIAVLHMLGERHHYKPSFSQQLNWILFERNDEYYVKAEANGKPLKLDGNANEAGEMEVTVFFEYLCSKLYSGDAGLVARGVEDPRQFDYVKIHCASHLDGQNTKESEVLLAGLDTFTDLSRPCPGQTAVQYEKKPYSWTSSDQSKVYHYPSDQRSEGVSSDGSWSSSGSNDSKPQSSTTTKSPSSSTSTPSSTSSPSSSTSQPSYNSITPQTRPQDSTEQRRPQESSDSYFDPVKPEYQRSNDRNPYTGSDEFKNSPPPQFVNRYDNTQDRRPYGGNT